MATLKARTSAFELAAVLKISIPEDSSLADLQPRLYSTAGATLQLDIQVLETDVMLKTDVISEGEEC